ncbi:MAG: transposase [Clostridia bacterium]|nr:transposase [Clostridia bacterium]
MSRSPFSPEERARIAQEYLDGKGSSYKIARKYGIHNDTVRQWAQRYAEQGILAFERGNGNTKYSKEFKTECVKLYLTGRMSLNEIVAEYNISNHSVLLCWIKKYTSNKELEDYDPHREVYMAEARRHDKKGIAGDAVQVLML